MRPKGWTIALVSLASIALLAVALALFAAPAEATVQGKQLPTYGNDWIIDEDTTVLGETITLQGYIEIQEGYTLRVRNTVISFNNSYPGEHGIYVATGSGGDGALELDDCTISSDYEDYGWFFVIEGAATIKNNVRLNNVQDGLMIFGDKVDISDMTLYAQGRYGIYIYRGDPTIKDSLIHLKVTVGNTGTGLYIGGSSSDRGEPTLDNLVVNVRSTDQFKYNGYSHYSRFYLYGIEMYYAKFDVLSNIEVTFDATVDGTMNYTGTPRMYVYFNIYALTMSGGTEINGFRNVSITNSNYYVDADVESAQSAYLYMYNYWYGIRNQISSSGTSPTTLGGISIDSQLMDFNANAVYRDYRYYYGRAIQWSPSTSSVSGATVTFDGLKIGEVMVDYFIDISDSWEYTIQNCEFYGNIIDDYFHRLYYWSHDLLYFNNLIHNNTMTRQYYFYMYYSSADITFKENNISGNTYYYFNYMYRITGEVIYKDNLFMDNQNYASTRLFYIYYINNDVLFEGNNFTNNSWYYMSYIYYNYRNVEFKDNMFLGNRGTSYMWYVYYNQAPLTIDRNTFLNNTLAGGVYMYYYQYNKIEFKNNLFDGNQLSNPILYNYYYSYSGGYIVTDNEFLNNQVTSQLFYFYATGYYGTLTVTVEDNYFYNNSGSTASNSGLIYFFKYKQDLAVRNNVFENNSANCINWNTCFSYYYDYPNPDSTLTAEGNTFLYNKGKGIVINEIDNCYVNIRNNRGTGNEDYPVYVYVSSSYLYDSSTPYMYNAMQGPDELRIENNNFSYNPGGGIFAKVSCYDSSYSYYNPGNPNQEIIVKKNILRGNGPDGWTLAVIDTYKRPSVKNNVFDESSMGQFYGLITNDARRTVYTMEYRDVVWDGGDEGTTAFGFLGVDATFYDSVFTNYTECFYAEDCEVNVYWSTVPEASGKTKNKGRIYIWNHLEILVTWANATGVDSGFPVEGAIVALRGANGDYFGAQQTGANGKLPMMIINPWTCIDEEMNALSPFDATLMANEISTLHEMHVVGDFIDPNYMSLTLVDNEVPQVIISNPQDNTLVKDSDVLGEGFLFEIGSGVTLFEGQTDLMAEDEWEPISMSVSAIWQHVFKGMTEGEHNVSVRAADLSGNWNTSTINIIVDLTKPTLDAWLEFKNTTVIPYNETQQGFYVRDKEIIINGSYSDNFADKKLIILRLNGEIIYQPPSRLGLIYETIVLDQGLNTLILDATDTAGNRQTVKLYISLDSYAPTLYIYEPLEGTKTGNMTLTVTGLTEPDTALTFEVNSVKGTRTYTSKSDPDGNFAFPVELYEGVQGFQLILVTATDASNNPTTVDRNVKLDTTPPTFKITHPEDLSDITKETRYDITGQMDADTEAIIYIGGQEVPNTGAFSRNLVVQEGENLIEVIAIDDVGNVWSETISVFRDTVKPEMEVLTPEGDYLLTSDTEIYFSGTVSGASRVVVNYKGDYDASLVDGTWMDGSWEYTLTLPSDEDEYISVTAIDEAGNERQTLIHIEVDVSAPSLDLDDLPENVETPRVNISGRTDDEVTSVYVAAIEYPVTEGEFVVVWSLAAGWNNFTVEVMDEAGNVRSEPVSVFYDYTPPEPIDTGDEGDEGISSIYGWALIMAAFTIIVVAFIVMGQRTRRR